jgi:hypothetical protein
VSYKGKVDWWIGMGIVAGICMPAVAALSLHNDFLLAPPALLVVFMLTCCYPQKYEVLPDALVVKAGLTRRAIPWSGISFAGLSSDSRSSLALSLDRVAIRHAGGEILIAPDDSVHFMEDVASHCPQLSRRGTDLVGAQN